MTTASRIPRLLAFVGHNDADILPFFLAHYRKLGVSRFLLALHGPWPEAVLDGLTSNKDVAIWDLLGGIYDDAHRRSILNLMAEGEYGRWVLVVDVDEFLELPLQTLPRMIDALELMGEAAMPAFLLQRVTVDGSLPPLDPILPIESQFPHGYFGLCEAMQTERPVWKTKYPLAKVTSDFKIDRGNHWPSVKGAQAHLPIRGVVHHYKWRAALKSALDLTRGPSSNRDEMASYRHWLNTHGDRLPVAKARLVSRDDLFARGLMVKPTRRQLLHGSLRRKLRAKGAESDERHLRLRCQLDRLATFPAFQPKTPVANGENGALTLTDPRHLLLPPGRICLVTFDLTPPLTSGGIGTAMAALADHLSAAGHEVHLLFCPYDGPSDLWQLWYDYWSKRGVALHYLPRIEGEQQHYLQQGLFLKKITRFLDEHQFDVVHVADAAGYGQSLAILRAAGLASARTRIIITAHGGIAWHRRGNHLPWTRDEAEATFAEDQMLRLADLVCCPSQHARDQLLEQGAVPPERLIILRNGLADLARSYGHAEKPHRAVREFVMIGRIEPRKGIARFAEAIRRLQEAGRFEFDITFLGTPGPGVEIDDVRAMLGAKGETAGFIHNFDPQETINYLRSHDCLVVVPSFRENLPYAVYECLENGIPMLASDAGGIPELIADADRERIMIAADPTKLAEAMGYALRDGAKPGRLSFDPSDVALKHLALHAKLVDEAKRPVKRHAATDLKPPAVAALIYGHGRLDEALEERRLAMLPDPLTVVETGGEMGRDGWVIEANAKAETLSTEWLVLCHALVMPHEGVVAAMLELAANSGMDAVTTGYRVALMDGGEAGPEDWLLAPGGPSVFSPSWNLFGPGLILISRKRFSELRGFQADGVPDRFAHWDLLNRLLARKGEVIGIPYALATGYCLRAGDLWSDLSPRFAEVLLAPWLERTPPDMQAILRKAAGESFGQCPETQRAEAWLMEQR